MGTQILKDMKEIKLASDAELLYCPTCKEYKKISHGVYKVEIAENDEAKDTQDNISLYSHFKVICRDCKDKFFKKKEESKK